MYARKKGALPRRDFMFLMGTLACCPLLSSCTSEAKPITVGLDVWPGYAPLPLAHSLGWLDEKQVRLVETRSATDSLQLLKDGRIDAAGLTLDEVLRARENGIPLSILLVFDISTGADMFLTRPEIKTLADIKGCRIGMEDGAVGALVLHQVLRAAELGLTDIRRISLPINQQADAWKSGDIDALVTYEPEATRIMALGANRLYDSRMFPDLIFDVLAVRSTVLDGAHDKALRHLMATHLRALHYLNSNPDDASHRMAKRFKLPQAQVMPMFRGMVLPDLNRNLQLLAASPPLILKSIETICSTLCEAGLLHGKANVDGLLRPEYLPAPENS